MDSSTASHVITLTEEDIEGALLQEPLDSYTVEQLRWWLLCHGIMPASADRKQNLIERIREAKGKNVTVVDVDGTYLEKKRQCLILQGIAIAPLPIPQVPMCGWIDITDSTPATLNDDFPCVTPSVLYTYLAEGVGNSQGKKAFRALKRGYIHYASNRIYKIEIQNRHSSYAFLRMSTYPSMKPAMYKVTMILKKDNIEGKCMGRVVEAHCECAAGLSASCVHVSSLLHALVALKPVDKALPDSSDESEDDAEVPVTSRACAWKPPRKRKSSCLTMCDVEFQKYVYGNIKRYKLESMENFDPRPVEYRGNAQLQLHELIEQVKGKGLCVSLLFDSSTCTERVSIIPTKEDILKQVENLKKKLSVTEEDIRHIEMETRAQRHSKKWYEVRRWRLTASKFGYVRRLKPTTHPDNLVLGVLGVKCARAASLEYGKDMEAQAIQAYTDYKHKNGYQNLCVVPSGFIISKIHSFLGASPDGAVYDPDCVLEPFGFLEIKCAYKYRELTPLQAAQQPDFWSTLVDEQVKLKENHIYYSQVQGQMAMGTCQWCDFVTYTQKGIHVERIKFNNSFWDKLLPKLISFFEKCIAPEIVAPQNPLGLPIRDFREEV